MKITKLLKTLALIIAGLAFIFFGMFILGEGIPNFKEIDDPQLKNMLFLMLFALAGYVFAWFREKEGGLILLISGFLLGMNLVYYNLDDWVPGLIYALPFAIPGVMLLLSSRKNI
jgi:hypothetical protein